MSMRKSKYDSVPLPQQGENNDSENDNINAIEKRIEHSAEITVLAEQTEIVKQLLAELQKVQACAERSMEEQRKSIMMFDAAVQSSDNIVNSICHAIYRAENTVITAQLSREDKDALTAYRLKLVEDEKTLFEKQMAELKQLHEAHWNDVRKFIKAESGFYLRGWVAKWGFILFWLLYAYFCLTVIGFFIFNHYGT